MTIKPESKPKPKGDDAMNVDVEKPGPKPKPVTKWKQTGWEGRLDGKDHGQGIVNNLESGDEGRSGIYSQICPSSSLPHPTLHHISGNFHPKYSESHRQREPPPTR